MRCPCLNRYGEGVPCDLAGANKNNSVCMDCEDRCLYVDAIGRCLSASMELEVKPAAGLG